LFSVISALIFVLVFNIIHKTFKKQIRPHDAPPDPTVENEE
jgi:hypothetical protein